jgi:predicted oxidoreductase
MPSSPSLVQRQRRRIGSEITVAPVAFGCWRLIAMPTREARARVEVGLEAGLDLFDTADVYGLDWGGSGFGAAEELLGQVFAEAPALRDRMCLASKGGITPGIPYDSRAEHLETACEASLRRLQTDRLDLYQVHRPDLFTHPDEVARAFDRLRAQGKIREAGVSNHTPAQLEALAAAMPFPLATSQPELSVTALGAIRDGHLDVCMRLGVTPLAWSPLAGGKIATGEGIRPELVVRLDALAEREGVSRAEIAVAFVLAHPAAPIPILGTMNPDRLRAALRPLEIQLDRADVYALIEASEGVPLP